MTELDKKPTGLLPKKMRKTYKRQVACVIVFLFFVLVIFAAIGTKVDLIEARTGIISILVYPVFGFLSLAFGLDVISKQTTFGGEPQDDDDAS